MEELEAVERAQLWGGHPTSTKPYRHCAPFKLPANGVIVLSPESTITLSSHAVFTPQCTSTTLALPEEGGGVSSVADMRDPFHASITPQAYATGAATVMAWMLVIMLVITPRTFFVGGASGRSGLLGRRGMIGGATGGGSVIGVGSRPWLQKVAAMTVAISLTVATADTFKIAGRQYGEGFMDAMELRQLVVSSMEIKVSRVISDVFLWLAQVQTLIRLFPRHKEKVIIKWVGFALILLDITFTSLNSFGPYHDNRHPRHFETAIPALSYLFTLSLSMLYAAWVMYYAITKRRYAFYHPMMWNITIVAFLSIIAILTPVVFFITDISNYTIAGWGDYFRWVGAAAASVIVWEWVERIEALEREERKDGILGREIYDGDEMLETTPSHEFWPRTSDDLKKSGDGQGRGGGVFTSGAGHGLSSLAHRLGRSKHQEQKTDSHKPRRSIHIPAPAPARRRSDSGQRSPRNSRPYLPRQDAPPVPVIASPVSRTETASVDSTVYTIRYHPVSVSPAAETGLASVAQESYGRLANIRENHAQDHSTDNDPEKAMGSTGDNNVSQSRSKWNWQATNPFRRRLRSPPPEVQRGRVIEPLSVDEVDDVPSNIPPRNYTGLALKDRLGTFAAHQGEKFRSKRSAGKQSDANLPVTIIPAQPRGRTWSPKILEQQQDALGHEHLEPQVDVSARGALPIQRSTSGSNPSGEVDNPASPTPEGLHATGAGNVGSASAANRNSHVRFAPEAFQRPGQSQRTGSSSRIQPQPQPPTSAVLGTEVIDFQPPVRPSPETSGDQSVTVTYGSHTHTNHDR